MSFTFALLHPAGVGALIGHGAVGITSSYVAGGMQLASARRLGREHGIHVNTTITHVNFAMSTIMSVGTGLAFYFGPSYYDEVAWASGITAGAALITYVILQPIQTAKLRRGWTLAVARDPEIIRGPSSRRTVYLAPTVDFQTRTVGVAGLF